MRRVECDCCNPSSTSNEFCPACDSWWKGSAARARTEKRLIGRDEARQEFVASHLCPHRPRLGPS